jgi:GNAT superfamily N-acetyltransferase
VVSLIEPTHRQVLDFCARDPVERVFLEDVARRGLGRFYAVARADGTLSSLCHVGANLVPSGDDCGEYADPAATSSSRMIIGEERAVTELWRAARDRLPEPREDRPGQPVYALDEPPEPGGTALRPATVLDLELLVPVCAAAHAEELGVNPLERDPEGFRWRTRAQIEDGRSQVWVDPPARRQGYGRRGMLDLCRLLLESTPTVTLFVRTENLPAIRLYESIGMRRVGSYRSILF